MKISFNKENMDKNIKHNTLVKNCLDGTIGVVMEDVHNISVYIFNTGVTDKYSELEFLLKSGWNFYSGEVILKNG